MSPGAEIGTESALPASLAFLNPHIVDDLTRYGNARDGGYVLPASTIAQIDAVLSFGLSTDWSLEEALCAAKPHCPVHTYDHTIDAEGFRRSFNIAAIELLSVPTSRQHLLDRLWRLRKAHQIGRRYRRFFTGNRIVHFHERVFNRRDNPNDATIETAFARLGDAKRVFLKMDIEGNEYRVLPQILAFSDRIDLMTIEFHDTDPLRPVFQAQIEAALEHFSIVHLHGNNIAGVGRDGLPECLEITFLNKRFPVSDRRRNRLPVPGLDRANDPGRPDLVIRFA